MDIHPWTKYEIARLRDEERLLRARDARHVVAAREAAAADSPEAPPRTGFAWISRIRRREAASGTAQAGSEAV
jgi:hypothetical protein